LPSSIHALFAQFIRRERITQARLEEKLEEQDSGPSVTAAELAEIGDSGVAHTHTKVPWRRLFRSRALWLIVLAYGCDGAGSWFYFSSFPAWRVYSAASRLMASDRLF